MLTTLSVVIWAGTSIFVPGLSTIAHDLNMNGSQLSLALTISLFSFAVTVLLVGPLSDAWGRKKFLVFGMILFTGGSIGCGVAQTINCFYLGRFLQGCAMGMIKVPVMAMVRDECPGFLAYKVFGLLGALTALIPVLAMLVGGLIIECFGWRSTFIVLSVAAAGSSVFSLFIPETLRPEDRLAHVNISNSFALYLKIVFSRQVLLVTSVLIFFAIFHGAYMFITPLAFAGDFKLSPTDFALYNIFTVGCMALGQFAATKAVVRFDPKKLYPGGAAIATLGGGLFIFLKFVIGMENAASFMCPLMFMAFSYGFIDPIGITSLFSRFRETAAMASAVFLSLFLIFQGAGSILSGLLLDAGFSTSSTMTFVIVPLGIILLVLAIAGRNSIHEPIL
ncbi:Major Facilitator Superfamily protein [Maridesulfovibrio ferrireducens]|uniref:Major Facilitator Superfamily protein n=1 Tax=Maridesulfovibrio ferrireducens TaxID=246191 RepID=A0A1G9JSL7_9BACT|nr:MFS transporter [Maridesulfovibrio ferrireducens]SDL40266.1 Major Facilitator Superfamily protein [Maridesulfovibrio ferrireducens]